MISLAHFPYPWVVSVRVVPTAYVRRGGGKISPPSGHEGGQDRPGRRPLRLRGDGGSGGGAEVGCVRGVGTGDWGLGRRREGGGGGAALLSAPALNYSPPPPPSPAPHPPSPNSPEYTTLRSSALPSPAAIRPPLPRLRYHQTRRRRLRITRGRYGMGVTSLAAPGLTLPLPRQPKPPTRPQLSRSLPPLPCTRAQAFFFPCSDVPQHIKVDSMFIWSWLRNSG